jgi:hypothetical protein
MQIRETMLYLGDQLKKINIVSFRILLLFTRHAYVMYERIIERDNQNGAQRFARNLTGYLRQAQINHHIVLRVSHEKC